MFRDAIGGFTLAALIYICFRASQSTAGAKLWSEDDRSFKLSFP
jgi:hypothetical protein